MVGLSERGLREGEDGWGRLRGPKQEDRHVGSSRNLDDDRFFDAFVSKVHFEPLPQFTGLDPDDVVVCRVVVLMAPKDEVADLLLGNLLVSLSMRSLTNISEEALQTPGPLEVRTGSNAINEFSQLPLADPTPVCCGRWR